MKPTSHSSFTAGESGFEVLNREDVTARSNGWPLTPPSVRFNEICIRSILNVRHHELTPGRRIMLLHRICGFTAAGSAEVRAFSLHSEVWRKSSGSISAVVLLSEPQKSRGGFKICRCITNRWKSKLAFQCQKRSGRA